MKKLFACLLVLALALSFVTLTGCPAKSEVITVGFAQCKADESDWRMHNTRSVVDSFSIPGYRIILKDSDNDAARQIDDVRGFISTGVDYIIIAAVNEAGWDTVLGNAQDAGIPVILMDRTITAPESLYTAWFGGSFVEEGRRAVAWMETRFGQGEANIVHIQGQLGAAAQIGRSEALVEGAQRNGWNILATQTGDWGTDSAKHFMTSAIRQHGSRINAVYAENDNMALGAIQALEEAGIPVGGADGVAIITFDANKWSLEMTLDGRINCNVECNPMLGPTALQYVETLKRGETLPKKSIAPFESFYWDTITQEMIDARAY